MNIAEFKRRRLLGYNCPLRSYLPVKKTEAETGSVTVKTCYHNWFDIDKMIWNDELTYDSFSSQSTVFAIINSDGEAVFTNKGREPTSGKSYEVTLPVGNYIIKILRASMEPKEKTAKIEVLPNKNTEYTIERFPGLYRHEFLFGSPDGASVFDCDPDEVYSNQLVYSVNNIYCKTENIYRCIQKSGVLEETLICKNKNVPQMGVTLGSNLNACVYALGFPAYASISEKYMVTYSETLEFMGFGTVSNNMPVFTDGISINKKNAIIKRIRTTFIGSGIPPSETENYYLSDAYMPTMWGMDYLFNTEYDPETKNYTWEKVGNRFALKRTNQDGTFMYRYSDSSSFNWENALKNGWEEVPNSTYIRSAAEVDAEFFAERSAQIKYGGGTITALKNSYGVIFNGEKYRSSDGFYVYHKDIGEDRYVFENYTYYADDYDQY